MAVRCKAISQWACLGSASVLSARSRQEGSTRTACSSGDRAPLLLFAAQGERIGAGQDGLVAVLAVPAPEARPGLEHGLEGAEPAVGPSAASGQVERRRQGLPGDERGGLAGQ